MSIFYINRAEICVLHSFLYVSFEISTISNLASVKFNDNLSLLTFIYACSN